MNTSTILLGKKGEELVAHYLIKQGYSVITTNFSSKIGEIDIIARKQNVLTFVEVKLRNYHYLSMSEIISPTKQRKITKTALLYLAQHPYENMIIRFDAALLEFNGHDYTIQYFENAFTHQGDW